MTDTKEKFIIIDGNALIHRAWHALPPLTTKKGELVNAVYGFTMILLRVLKDFKPQYVAVTFDLKAPTFRHKDYKEYKAKRVKQPDELYEQIPKIKEIVTAFNVPVFEKEGFEADDLIGTIAKKLKFQNSKIKTIIVTGDLDTLQLVNANIEVYTMHKGISDSIVYDEEAVGRRFGGLAPAQLIDYKALRGDASDNIPGVPGIGEKTAINLIQEFKTIENLYKNLDSQKITPRFQKILKEHEREAIMSKKLVTIVTDVPMNFKLEDCKLSGFNIELIIPLFQKLEFKTLLSRLPKDLQADSKQLYLKKFSAETGRQGAFLFTDKNQPESDNLIVNSIKSGAKYYLVDSEVVFKKLINDLKKQKSFVFDTETSGLNPFEDRFLGLSFCWQAGEAYFLPNKPKLIKAVKPILENPKIKKHGHNIKFDIETLKATGIEVLGLGFDTMVASYLTNPGTRQHSLDNLVFTELGYQMQSITDLIGKGKNQITLADVPIQKVSDYSCEDADFTFRLINKLTEQLKEKNNLALFQKIEMPLISILADMERIGVKIDIKFLNKMSEAVGKKIYRLESEIHKLAGIKFNVNSPIQLKEILFDRLNISVAGLGHTKTGTSTAADELEKIKDKHKIIPKILEYRELSKLKSTYLDTLPELVSKVSGRVHTSFNQTVTATGRLSSSNPNLQNIPIRTELGQEIRKAFVAKEGFKLIVADYSQIELRLIASLANDLKMIESFQKREDIHAKTASEINGIPLKAVTRQMRRAAKAINFGIIYGMGAYGLSAQEGITHAKAREFIDKYFKLHRDIKKYIENTKDFARKYGFVETLFGRRRYLPEINSGVQNIRAAAERMAVNHPVQGSCADLIKLAMIDIFQELPKISKRSKMILQVHDELVFEAPESEVNQVAKLIKYKMEHIYKLRVPIDVEQAVGNNWGELKELK